MTAPRHLAIVGTTASGKSAVALALAEHLGNAEIVSVDSMQVYRGMDIGTAKPTAAERAAVPHHLIDLVEPSETYDVSMFQAQARKVRAEIEGRGNTAIFVGGTGLYLRAIVDDLDLPGQFPNVRAELEVDDTERLYQRLVGLDPLAAQRMEPTNRRRIVRALEVTLGTGRQFSSFGPGLLDYQQNESVRLYSLWIDREHNAARIRERIQRQLADGWLDEVKRVSAAGMSITARQALGYEVLEKVVQGTLSIDDATEQICQATVRFSRRQRAWFRRDPRLHWFGWTPSADPSSLVPAVLMDRHQQQ